MPQIFQKLLSLGMSLLLLAGLMALVLAPRKLPMDEFVEEPLAVGAIADRVYVEKSAHRMTLLKEGKVLKTYPIALGFGGPGQKQKEGDGKTPEGVYRIEVHNPNSVAHLSLKISYPTPEQRKAAAKVGVDPGGFIMIHGLMNGFSAIGKAHRQFDWTNGCIAVTNEEMDEIWRAVADGTEIEIVP